MEDFDKLWMELLFSFHSFNQTLASHGHSPPFSNELKHGLYLHVVIQVVPPLSS